MSGKNASHTDQEIAFPSAVARYNTQIGFSATATLYPPELATIDGAEALSPGLPGVPGIVWSYTIIQGVPQFIAMIQLAQICFESANPTPGQANWFTYNTPQYWLDVGSGTSSNVYDDDFSTSGSWSNQDNPYVALGSIPTPYNAYMVNNSFEDFFLYKPRNGAFGKSTWVTVGLMTWSWAGETLRQVEPPGWQPVINGIPGGKQSLTAVSTAQNANWPNTYTYSNLTGSTIQPASCVPPG